LSRRKATKKRQNKSHKKQIKKQETQNYTLYLSADYAVFDNYSLQKTKERI